MAASAHAVAQRPGRHTDVESAPENSEHEELRPLIDRQRIFSPRTTLLNVEQFIFLFWATAVIVTSTGLINYNRYMMQEDVFPFAVPLVMLHMLASSVLGFVLLMLCPGLFPSIQDECKSYLSNEYLFKRLAPIAILQASSQALSNTAYKYASVSFLQMLKQGNVLLVYVLSLLAGIESFRGKQAVMLVLIVGAMYASLSGDLHFSLLAFLVQGSCCFAESSKIVLQGVLLGGKAYQLDPMSFVLFVCPQVFVLLLSLRGWQLVIPSTLEWLVWPTWDDFLRVKFMLLGNVMLAFLLNLVTAIFLRYGSPLGFLLTNIVKDGMIVIGSAIVLKEPLSREQMVSFPIQLALIFLYSLSKMYPHTLQKEGVTGLLVASVRGTAK